MTAFASTDEIHRKHFLDLAETWESLARDRDAIEKTRQRPFPLPE